MKRLMKKLEDIMVAVTFAESGEYETAIEMLNEGVRKKETETEPEPSTEAEAVHLR